MKTTVIALAVLALLLVSSLEVAAWGDYRPYPRYYRAYGSYAYQYNYPYAGAYYRPYYRGYADPYYSMRYPLWQEWRGLW